MDAPVEAVDSGHALCVDRPTRRLPAAPPAAEEERPSPSEGRNDALDPYLIELPGLTRCAARRAPVTGDGGCFVLSEAGRHADQVMEAHRELPDIEASTPCTCPAGGVSGGTDAADSN